MLSVSTWTLLAVLGAGGETVLLDFTAPWCGPCQSMTPIIHRLESEGFPVRQVNIDKHAHLAAQYGVTNVPCFVMLVDGREVDREVGLVGHDRLVQMFTVAKAATSSQTPQVRGQSPDRLSLAGRLRQAVGGRHESPGPPQPSATPPAAISAGDTRYEPVAGPEPPAVLGSFTTSAEAPLQSASGVPSMAPAYQAEPAMPPASSSVPLRDAAQQFPTLNAAAASPEDRALAASVRLRIDDGQFFSYATGSVVAIRPDGEAIILTCGHVFRDSQGRGAVDVELFGATRQGPLQGQVVAFDLERDLGLVSVRGATNLSPVTIAGNDGDVREGLRAFSIGCDRGAEPSLREGRIAGVNRYLGTPNLVVTGQPVVGRSGGGLFNSQGSLIGVCRAADAEVDEGVYVSYVAVRDQLQVWGLSELLQSSLQLSPSATQLTDSQAASPAQTSIATPEKMMADKPADFDYTRVPSLTAGGEIFSAPNSAGNRFAATTEPVFIVRADGSGEVLMVERPSPAFLEQLARESAVRLPDAQLPPAVRVAAEAFGGARNLSPTVVRGQSPYPPAIANNPRGVVTP